MTVLWHARAQPAPPPAPADDTLPREAKPPIWADRQELAEWYKNRDKDEARSVPRIVFIPGMLGSKIEECDGSGGNCKTLWGTLDSLARGADLSFDSDKTYRSEVLDRAFFNKNIYAQLLEYIEDRYPGRNVLNVFSYDWRRSGVDNAKDLGAFICAMHAQSPERPISFIAHSMGGLILRHWLKFHHSSGCDQGQKLNIQHIAFVATPNTGSSKAVKSLIEGHSLYFQGTSVISNLFAQQERRLLVALNKAGPTFPSFYELLPIQSSDYCRAKVPALSQLPSAVVTGDERTPVNVFDARIWHEYRFLKKAEEFGADVATIRPKLQTLLRNAETFLCNLVSFNPADIADVTYFWAQPADVGKSTVSVVQLKRKRPSGEVEISYETDFGDGTVLHYSACDQPNARQLQIQLVHGDHMSILDAAELRRLIGQWFYFRSRVSSGTVSRQ